MTEHSSSRIEWVDFAKGVAIILVVAGHTILYGDFGPIVKKAIYSIHMPLFFLLSGFTFRTSDSVTEFLSKTRKGISHLILPTFIAYCIKIIIAIIFFDEEFTHLAYWKNALFTLVFSCSKPFTYSGMRVQSIGYIWFIMPFFLARLIYDYLHLILKKEQFTLSICILSLLGYLIGFHTYMPLGLEHALSTLPLIYVGNLFHKINWQENVIKKSLFSFLTWIILFLFTSLSFAEPTHLDIAAHSYPLFPLCYICAIFGTLFVCECSLIVAKFKISHCISFIGKNSLYFLFAHYFDSTFEFLWKIGNNQYLRFGLRLAIDICIFFIILAIKYAISLFNNTKVKRHAN